MDTRYFKSEGLQKKDLASCLVNSFGRYVLETQTVIVVENAEAQD